MLARYMLSYCVRPSVCPSQAGTVPKELNAGSCKQRDTIAQGLSCLMTKIPSPNPTALPHMGAPNRGGVGSNWQFSTYILLSLRNGAREGHNCYGTLIGTDMHSIEWLYLQ